MKKLDFIVFGMPRGGTSAVARYISSVDALYCGLEVFPTSLDHSTIDVPQGFLTRQHERWGDAAVADVTVRADTIERYGNKTPFYFYRLAGILKELDNCPAIFCVRDLRSIAMSYSTRAANPKDTWDSGRRGLFAVGDAIMMVHILLSLPDEANVLIIPQAALLDDWQATMTEAVGFIAPGIAASFNPDRLGEIDEIKTTQGSRTKVDLVPVEETAMRRIAGSGLNEFFTRGEIMRLADVRQELVAIRDKCPPNPINFMRRLVENHPEPTAPEFFERWSKLAGNAWRRIYGRPGAKRRKPAAQDAG